MNRETLNRCVLVLVVLFISAVFLSMIRHFLMAIFLAGIFSALAHPICARFEHWYRGRRALASLTTILMIVFLILLPLGLLLGIITAQAINVGQSVTPWIQEYLSKPGALSDLKGYIPFFDVIEPYKEPIFRKAGELVGTISRYLINGLSSATVGTVHFMFALFILLYTMFYFLMEGDKVLAKILYYLPLKDDDERRMLEKFTSVTRATLKGTAVIGILQGGLAGMAFFAMGIPSALFWGTIMAVLSVIPGIGTALVWAPAAVVLAVSGHVIKAIFLVLFCGLVVGSMDNFLRPRLVGKDTEMHDLMILFGTLGGIALFGVMGVIIGPIVAALFVTVWEIYGAAFQDVLPDVGISYKKSREKDADDKC